MSVTGSSPIDFNHARLSTGEFNQLARLVYSTCGIHLPPTKKIMLEGRLAKRLRALGVRSFKEYIGYLATDEGIEHELVHMIDVVTTNKTDFFREPHHFDYLTSTILPAYHKQHHGRKPFRIWSAACSTGEEPYTIA
ncbi:MAG TPA: CheR family methyltransferase, partial [Ohtaekwangia sp.]|uniref:CheR family methyltransferase n=1 Tax=Ohtaekwangia sp. TaxID=2066019 RepID=UPI002F95C3C4